MAITQLGFNPDEDVTLTVTDSGDYTITIPTLPTLGDGWDYQIRQQKNGIAPRFFSNG